MSDEWKPTPEHLVVDAGGEWSTDNKDREWLMFQCADEWSRDRDEIERLRKWNRLWRMTAWKHRERASLESQFATALQRRIEELEKDVIQLLTSISTGTQGKYHWITTDQIDAVWKAVEESYVGEAIEEGVNELGIMRCERWGGL